MKRSLKQYIIDVFWQPLKAVICAIQLYIILHNTMKAQADFMDSFEVLPWIVVEIFTPLTIFIAMFALWKFYDGIDDAAFVSLCMEEGESTPFLKRLSWLIALLISAVACGIPVGLSLWRVMMFTGISASLGYPLCILGGILLTLGIRALMIHLLFKKWMEQSVYFRDPAQYPSLRKRIFQAILFAIGLICASLIGVATLFWGAYSVLYGVAMLVIEFLWPIVAVILLIILIHVIRLLSSRRKFLKRLKKMQAKGEIHYDYMGHPYLSVLSRRVYFGLVITDYTNGVGENKKPKTYRIVVVGTWKRRLVIACDHNTYQFKHEIRLRMNIRTAAIAASSDAPATGVALATWYSTYGFAFPGDDDTEGEPVVIFDPVPYAIFVRPDDGRNDLRSIDNSSKVYGYTVWAKNSFANFLERT